MPDNQEIKELINSLEDSFLGAENLRDQFEPGSVEYIVHSRYAASIREYIDFLNQKLKK